jgi:hypothetical protein
MTTAYSLELFNPQLGQWVRLQRRHPFTTATEAVIYGLRIFPSISSRWAAIQGE